MDGKGGKLMEEQAVEQFLAWQSRQVFLALELEDYERHLAAQGLDDRERRSRLERVREFFRRVRAASRRKA